jgi:hypothetical protein
MMQVLYQVMMLLAPNPTKCVLSGGKEAETFAQKH